MNERIHKNADLAKWRQIFGNCSFFPFYVVFLCILSHPALNLRCSHMFFQTASSEEASARKAAFRDRLLLARFLLMYWY